MGTYLTYLRRRLDLAAGLLHRPKLLVLDEPTDGLDPQARAGMRKVLERLRDEGVTIFLNSHILQEVELICDRVAILHKGEMRYCGSVEDIGARLRAENGEQETFEVELKLQGEANHLSRVLEGFPEAEVVQGAEIQVGLRVQDQVELDRLVDRARSHGFSLIHLQRNRVSLEDAFLSIVGGEATESEGAKLS